MDVATPGRLSAVSGEAAVYQQLVKRGELPEKGHKIASLLFVQIVPVNKIVDSKNLSGSALYH